MGNLKKTLGLTMLCFYGTGMILGAGIYSIIGKAAAHTGPTLWMGFVFAGVAALLTALSYAELATMFPKAGAEFIFFGEAFPKKKWIAGTAGIAMVFSGAATATTVALAFADYLARFFETPEKAVAGAVLVVFTGVAIIGIKASGWVTVVSTLIEVGGLIFIIYLGLTSEKFGQSLEMMPTAGTLTGTALIIFSFFGFENIVNLAEETKKPERDLPRAILISVVVSTVLYVLVSLSALALISTEKLAASSAPLMLVAQSASANAGKILGAVALFSTANTALISMIGASRILYSMGTKNMVPTVASAVLPRRKTPWVASLVTLGVALLLLPSGGIETVASASSLATVTVFFLVNVALIVLRFTQGETKRAFRVPLAIGKVPILPCLGALVSLLLLTQYEAKVYQLGGGCLLVAALWFTVSTREKRPKNA